MKTAALEMVRECRKIAEFFRYVASVRHGVPLAPDTTPIAEEGPNKSSTSETVSSIVSESSTPSPQGTTPAVATAASGVSRFAKGVAVGVGFPLAASALVGLGGWLRGVDAPARETPGPRTIERQRGSVLPYLEEGGYHLPPAK